MLNIESTDKISLITSSAADLDVHVSYVDITTAGVQTPDKQLTQIAGAATNDILAAPAATVVRNVKHISIKNKHASTSNTVTPQIDVSATLYELAPDCILLAGESLVHREGEWLHYDANGVRYGSVAAAATQADMEAGTSLTSVVTPGRMHFHPGANKFWVIFTGNTTTITASYNMSSITDGSNQATVTIATDFSGSAWCVLATAVGAAVSVGGARHASCLTMAAGSIIVFCTDASATPALVDPTSWCVTGLGDHT